MTECHYCKRKTFDKNSLQVFADPRWLDTIDHRVPRAIAGRKNPHTVDNEVHACARCNSMKAATPYEVFVAYVREFGNEGLNNELKYRKFCYDLMLQGLRQYENNKRYASVSVV